MSYLIANFVLKGVFKCAVEGMDAGRACIREQKRAGTLETLRNSLKVTEVQI